MRYQVNITRTDNKPVGQEIIPKLLEYFKKLGIHRQSHGPLSVSGGIWVKVGCRSHLTLILDKLPGSFQLGGTYKATIGQQHRYKCIELYGVIKHQNLVVLRDQLNKAYPEANILNIVRLLKSGNKNKVKLDHSNG